MPAMELGDHRAGFDIGRGKQGRRAMAPIIMRPPSSLAGPHRQRRLGTVQGLNLRFLVNTEDGGVRRRIHIQADAVTHLVDQPRAGRELECLTAVGLQAEGVPNLLDGRPGPCRSPSPCLGCSNGLPRRGVPSSVRTITCSIWSSVMRRGAPGRGSSYNLSSRSRTNRARHSWPLRGGAVNSC